eukprot:SAG11_NODE_23303_length_391_cov_0.883562_1_plen_46_part_10
MSACRRPPPPATRSHPLARDRARVWLSRPSVAQASVKSGKQPHRSN